MDAYNIHITGDVKLFKLLSFDMEVQVNHHAHLVLKAIIKDQRIEETAMFQGKHLEVQIDTEGKTDTLFSGVVVKQILDCGGALTNITIHCLSASLYFDQVKMRQSFQSMNMTYGDVLRKLSDRSKSIMLVTGHGKKLNGPLIQYDETDWEFIKRIAARLNTVLIPDIKHAFPQVAVGFVEGRQYELNDIYDYEICSERSPDASGSKKDAAYYSDSIVYRIKSGENYQLGDRVFFLGRRLVVLKKEVNLKKGTLEFTYILGMKHTLALGQSGHNQGLSLRARVLEVFEEKIRLEPEFDSGDKKDVSQLYAYNYIPVTGNVMYSMPEAGSQVYLYFPTEKEKDGVVVSCIHEDTVYPEPAVKQMETSAGKRLRFTPETIEYSNENRRQWIALEDRPGISIATAKKLKIRARGNIKITASHSAEINAKKIISLREIKSDDRITISGGEVEIKASKIISSGLPHQVVDQALLDRIKPAIKRPEQYALNIIGGLNQGNLTEIQSAVLSGIPLFEKPGAFHMADISKINRKK